MSKHVTKILNGRGLAAKRRMSLKQKIANETVQPTVAVLMIGHDSENDSYQAFVEQANETGIVVETVDLPENVSETRVNRLIDKMNKSKKIHGIMVQLPVPAPFDVRELGASIDVEKDIDCIHPENIGWVTLAAPRFMPSMTQAIWTMVEQAGISVKGKRVVIVGANNIVGKPSAQLLANHGATVTLCHSLTEHVEEYTADADIIITATGKPGYLQASMVKQNAIVIDAGATYHEGEIVGDVLYDEVAEKASYITPVPDGVSPMTIVSLLENTWKAACLLEGLDDGL
jgi:methylenetetrahydrofolate dehydrogenase (NADP+)/methenyltetrahydrofolate cyclohydrolase